ncbi:MAG TPA: hypothetical protein VK816_11580 [Jatrophihabitantaceae bacterium]|jgi:hypothetical protein|nr:hypothetical protein [Jatrophihabitantaceae bacterium]
MNNQQPAPPAPAPHPAQTYAVLDGDLVVNIIAADPSFVAGSKDHVRIDGLTPRPGPGWRRTPLGWSAPPPPPTPPMAPLLSQLAAPAPACAPH